MNLYDNVIREWNDCIRECGSKAAELSVHPVNWKDAGANNMVFRSDMSAELGGDLKFHTSGQILTENVREVPQDEILLIGPDIPALSGCVPFSRLAFIRVKENSLGEDNALYNAVRGIEFTKYHVNPEGYMLRISSGSGTESVRISKKAAQQGLDFETVGNMYLQAFHKNRNIEAVRLVFITDEEFPFDLLKNAMKAASDITKAIDHILKDASMTNCSVCSLQEVCDEVEGLREMHFRKNENRDI